ncbi:MAG: ABC transporter substrate-binding protein [Microthrixaceae bacterium]
MNHQRLTRLAAVATVFAVATIGCGKDDTASTPGTTAKNDSGSTSGDFIVPAKDCANYEGTKGINGDTIKIGTVRPASGNFGIYDLVTQGLDAFVKATNMDGGVKAGDGKTYKLELAKGDDQYDPAKTPGEVQRLVEQEGVFAMVGEIGTSNNLAVRQYMNEKCVPSIALATGSTEWGESAKYPWFIGGLPSYATETHRFVDFLKKDKPEATIALLYQDDDFGKEVKAAMEKSIKGSKIKLVDSQSYNPLTEASPESKVAALAGSKADVLFVGIAGTPCPTALKSVPDTWKPMTYVSITCSVKTAMSLAGGKDEGVYTGQATLDPATDADRQNPKIQEYYTKGAAAGLSESLIEGGIAAAGWGFGAMFVEGLKLAKTVDRAGVMNALWSMKDVNYGLMRDDTKANTDGAKDPWALESLRIVRREAGQWKEVSPMISYDGQSNDLAG